MGSIKKLTDVLLETLPNYDHRVIGLRQRLFFFNELSQGSSFFEPRGAHIYNKLTQYLRSEYRKRNYQEVITPNVFNSQLWKTSGHWDHYKDHMMRFQIGDREFSLKPMNCPGHCLMFKHQGTVTKDQLPIRWADFGVLHRNEDSGALKGLSRVRRFQQDDAHIFCTQDQIESEVKDCLQFASAVYGKFNFTFDLELSLRPENYLGESKVWDQAEDSLRQALKGSNNQWQEQKFEGAFYGPKIDLQVKDCSGKSYQCATIQLDFQLPERFDLTYKDPELSQTTELPTRPVIIHRAILGSLERFIGMIAENTKGLWPFWLSPLQAKVIPVHEKFKPYARRVYDQLRDQGLWVDCDLSNARLNAKIRDAITMPYQLILIVGQQEEQSDSVNCRIISHKSETSPDIVHNLRFPLNRFIDCMKEFDERQVDRADLELLAEFGKP